MQPFCEQKRFFKNNTDPQILKGSVSLKCVFYCAVIVFLYFPCLFQTLSGIRPDSPFVWIPVRIELLFNMTPLSRLSDWTLDLSLLTFTVSMIRDSCCQSSCRLFLSIIEVVCGVGLNKIYTKINIRFLPDGTRYCFWSKLLKLSWNLVKLSQTLY